MDGTHALVAGLTSVLTLLFDRGAPFILQVLKIRTKETESEKKDVIARLDKRVEQLEGEIKESRAAAHAARTETQVARNEHRQCMVEHARLQARVELLEERMKGAGR